MILSLTKRSVSAFVVAVIALLAAPAAAWACSCSSAGPACQAFFATDVVFAGRVLSVTSQIRTVELGGGLEPMRESMAVVRMRVIDAYKNVSDKEVDIHTGQGAADCGYRFSVGGDYVIYAHANKGELFTSICSRTRPLSDAAEDLAFFRTMSSAPSVRGKLLFAATYVDDVSDADGGTFHGPFAGIKLSVSSSDGRITRTAATNASGTASVDVPPGSYRVEVAAPSGYYADPGVTEINLVDARGCAAVDLGVRNDGRLYGRVVDASGAPVPNFSVELGQRNEQGGVNWTTDFARTDAEGRYDFTHRPAGDYLVGINMSRADLNHRSLGPPIFLPGVSQIRLASVLTLPTRALVDFPDFVLPASISLVQLVGTALGSDGKPAANVVVNVYADDQNYQRVAEQMLTDTAGRFSFAVMSGVSYRIVCDGRRLPDGAYESGELRGVVGASGMAPVTLQMKKN